MDRASAVPWESCITMGNAWGWVPDDQYKSTKELIQLLVKIVAKGGNLLLGVGPDGRGEFDPKVYQRLSEMGEWLKINRSAIFNTYPVEPFQEGNLAYTANSENKLFAIYLPGKDEQKLPAELTVKTNMKGKLKARLPAFNQSLKVKNDFEGIKILIPASLQSKLADEYAIVFQIQE
jgi:alpha-L-fucosidase